MHATFRFGLGLSLACAFLACREPFSYFDDQPLVFARANNALVSRIAVDGVEYEAVVDTLSPFTAVHTLNDEFRSDSTVRLFGQVQGQWIPRAEFSRVDVFNVGICSASVCSVGAGSSAAVEAIIGTDVFGRVAARLLPSLSSFVLFPDVAGTVEERSELCESVFEQTMVGSGRVEVGGAEITYLGRRPVVGGCIARNDDLTVLEESSQGVDMTFLVGTGVPISVISESAYERYYAYAPGAATPLVNLPSQTVTLSSGPVQAKSATLPLLSLVGQHSQERGPCWERFATRLLFDNQGRCPTGLSEDDCPCFEDTQCSTAAFVDFSADLTVAVVPDTNLLLQSLRDELRPIFPEVDGIIAATALAGAEIDFDYPNQRIIMRCTDPALCSNLPRIVNAGDLGGVEQCN